MDIQTKAKISENIMGVRGTLMFVVVCEDRIYKNA